MTRFLLYLAVFFAVPLRAARAASFDCARATRPVETLICGNPQLNAADERLGQAYRTGLGRLPTDAVGPLRADQVQWLAWMQEVCRAPLPDAEAKTAAPQGAVVACMLPLYDQRVKQLRTIAVERDGVRFLTRTQYLAVPENPASSGAAEFPGFGTLQASWPLALADGLEWQAWNRAAEIEARSLAGDQSAAAPAVETKPVQWTDQLAEEADTEITLHVMRVEHGRVTSAASVSTMGHGAAHPSEASETMTWLLPQQRRLRPGDVFAPGDAWKKVVAQACWKAIHSGELAGNLYPQVTGPDAKELQDVITDVGNWTLEHDGLHISYPEYSVAPRVVQALMNDTVIPWAALQPVLATGFTAP